MMTQLERSATYGIGVAAAAAVAMDEASQVVLISQLNVDEEVAGSSAPRKYLHGFTP